MNKKNAVTFAEEQIEKGISKQEVYDYLINNNDLGHKYNKRIVKEIATNESKLKFKNLNYILISILIFLYIVNFEILFNRTADLIELNPDKYFKYISYLIIYVLVGIFYIRSIYQFKFGNHLAAFICLPLLYIRTILELSEQKNISLLIDISLIIVALFASIIGFIIHKKVFQYPK